MPTASFPRSARLLLLRQGLVFCAPGDQQADEQQLQALDVLLAELGYVPSARLRARLGTRADLRERVEWLRSCLLEASGGGDVHTPLFRQFPHQLPPNTLELWWQKVGVHFLQAADEPCLFCGRDGTTHVLSPCRHVVCDRCFDGANYSACPVCEHHVDRGSPFFKAAPVRKLPRELHIRFKRLDLGDDLVAASRGLFLGLCARAQAMSGDDVAALTALAAEHDVRAWLPDEIPVRENVAHVYGALARRFDPLEVFAGADRHLKTATDALRFLAAYSGADPALLARRHREGETSRLVRRFTMARLPRPLRRALLGWLEARPAEALWEDMQRRGSWWVWAGEFLHPHEYAGRFPNVAQGFRIVRKRAPDGTRTSRFRTFAAKVERALAARDGAALLALLETRPGEFARRLDLALRLGDAGRVLAAFEAHAAEMATPVLLTLRAHLPARRRLLPVRLVWPKGKQGLGVPVPDARPLLDSAVIARATAAIDRVLLARFAALPALDDVVLDEALMHVPVPFNERTAARDAAIALPRGARWSLEAQARPKAVWRLFLHWCEPADGRTTDLDLSLAFYHADWHYAGVCSYYQLRHPESSARPIATSAGDLRSAPFPAGATEFIDLDRDRARAAGIRYAVAVINAYAGMAFGELERAYAGLMVRDDAGGRHFDPRTVSLKFALDGENGVFVPFLIDLETAELHWLDLYAKGAVEFNNVESSKAAIYRICRNMLAYFGTGTRPTMYQLGMLHAAARARRVFTRGGCIERGDDGPEAFLQRLAGPAPRTSETPAGKVLAMLAVGDGPLPEGSQVYCLQPALHHSTLKAADLLSAGGE